MKRLVIILVACTTLLGCKKEDVSPNETPQVIVSKHVILTVNNYQVGDSINIKSGTSDVTVRITRIKDKDNYLCNLSNNLVSVRTINDCNDGYLELYGVDNIVISYSGDVSVDYL